MAKTEFMGSSPLTLDGKGRLAIPARVREVLETLGATELIVTKHPDGPLIIFPPAAWGKFMEQIGTLPMEAAPIKRLFVGNATEVEPDASSRILIPPELRRYAGLERDVMLLGMLTHLELWDEQRYRDHEAASAKTALTALPEAARKLML